MEKSMEESNSYVRLHIKSSISSWSAVVPRILSIWADFKGIEAMDGDLNIPCPLKVYIARGGQIDPDHPQKGSAGFMVNSANEAIFSVDSIAKHIHNTDIDYICIDAKNKTVTTQKQRNKQSEQCINDLLNEEKRSEIKPTEVLDF